MEKQAGDDTGLNAESNKRVTKASAIQGKLSAGLHQVTGLITRTTGYWQWQFIE